MADTLENYTFRGGIVQSVYGISSGMGIQVPGTGSACNSVLFSLKSLFKRDLFGDNDVNGNSDVIGNNDDKTGNGQYRQCRQTPARNPAKESWVR